jgi:para-nitrobenzyl esterase
MRRRDFMTLVGGAQGKDIPMSCSTTIFALFLLAVIPATASAQTPSCAANEPDIACTQQGAVRGVVEGDMLAFKGIPYARPPVGPLRWKPTEAAEPWSGVRDGSRFGAICPQISGQEVKGDEDCLTINVWRPRVRPSQALPVMVWLTGGGNHLFSGQGTSIFGGLTYSGEKLVPQGVVFVSYNLRLGVLGFLAHPALDAERPEKISGNYGSLDQIAMLRWLKANISAFGGDPNKIFLFGTSAGGGNICALMTSPLTRGLVHGVAMQSSVPNGCEIQTLDNARNGTGVKVAAAVGCDAAADIAACLRGKSTAEIVSAVPGTFTVLPRLYGPNVDGQIFPDQPLKLIMEGKYPPMPVIIGNTSEETMPWADTAGRVTDDASHAAAIDKVFGAGSRERILAQYPVKSFPTPRLAFMRVTTDSEFTCQSRRVARAFSKVQREPVYRYIFTQAQENDPALKAAGVAHTVEHAFLFPGKYQPTEPEAAIQRQIAGYWARMARTGNPNGGNDPQWPASTVENDAYLEIGAATAAMKGPAEAKCDFWDTVPFPQPHL